MPPQAMSLTPSSKRRKLSGPKTVYFSKPNFADGYLSQWAPSKFEFGGETFETAEMWMMVKKARLFKDEVSYP